MAQRQGRSTVGTERILAKLKSSMDSGNYYEAHQMYRTLYFRCAAQEKYHDLMQLLYDGAVKMFGCEQVSSGADLANLYLEVLEKGKIQPSEDVVKKISNLFALIPPALPDKESFKNRAVKWSSSDKLCPNGNPRLHQLIAYELWKCGRYPESRKHFLYTSDGTGCGTMLVEYHTCNGYNREVDMFVAGTVLQMLCLRKHIVAAFTLKAYTDSHPSIRGPPYKYPLLNFIWLLLLAIEHKQSVCAYSILVEKYKTSLNRDPSYFEYLDKIGQQFFGLPAPQKTRSSGVLSNLLDSMLNTVSDDNDGTTATAASASTSSSTKGKMVAEELD